MDLMACNILIVIPTTGQGALSSLKYVPGRPTVPREEKKNKLMWGLTWLTMLKLQLKCRLSALSGMSVRKLHWCQRHRENFVNQIQNTGTPSFANNTPLITFLPAGRFHLAICYYEQL